MTASDLDLLRQYAREGMEDAFTALVNRHLDLVYSAALRQVGSAALAEEVAQSVFTDLARNALRLKPDTLLTAWLYQVARRTAIDVVRKESSRQMRERIALELADMKTNGAEWTQIGPLLDEAMEALPEADRSAILLRYFENRSLREVGQTLGMSEDAAQKRVSRAVERLRGFFSKQGLTVGAGGLAALLSANAVESSPVGLGATISAAAALSGAGVQSATALGAAKIIAMTTIQKTLIAATLAAAVGTGIYGVRRNSHLRDQLRAQEQREAPLAEQNRQLRQERDDATQQAAALRDDNERLKGNSAELLKLRGETGVLRRQLAETVKKQAPPPVPTTPADEPNAPITDASGNVDLLKKAVEKWPHLKIPELRFVTEKDWRLASTSSSLKTDDGCRWALSELRRFVEDRFAGMAMEALTRYMQANNGQFPTDLSQLQPYFKSPIDNAILQRYEIVPAKPFSDPPLEMVVGDWIIVSKAPVDSMDSRVGITLGGYGHAFSFHSPAANPAETNQ